jgi:hypothetical protein
LRRFLASAVGVLLVGGLLAGCSSDGSDTSSKVSVKKKGDELTAKSGDDSFSIGDAQVPKSFPSDDVPLPEGGALKAAVSGKEEGSKYFSLTYAVKGGDLKSAASDYKGALKDAGYAIEASSSVGGSSGSFSAFTAIGKDWDVIVYGGGVGGNGALSLQVTSHDPKKDLPGS